MSDVEYVVVWAGAAGDYLDPALRQNAQRTAAVATERTFAVRMTQEAPEAIHTPPRERRRHPTSIRSLLHAVLTAEWQTIAELTEAAQLPQDKKTRSNAANSLQTLYCHGDAEREFRRITRSGPGHRLQYVYRRSGVSESA